MVLDVESNSGLVNSKFHYVANSISGKGQLSSTFKGTDRQLIKLIAIPLSHYRECVENYETNEILANI